MRNRMSLLMTTGALAFGTLGYFLFAYDDGSAPKMANANHPVMRAAPRRIGGGAASAASPVSLPPGAPVATATPPSDTPSPTAPRSEPPE